MRVQIIKRDNKPEWAVIPYDDYLELVEKAEILQDVQDYDGVKAALARGDEELIPAEVVNAILDGANTIKTWREFRGIPQSDLAKRVNISIPYLSQLEANKRKGSLKVLTAIARELNISLDLITPAQG